MPKVLYLDTEFDGFGGALLSMALYAPDGKYFYEVINRPATNPWVKKHVVPFFNQKPIEESDFRLRLHTFLLVHNGCTIVADWPEDFIHLLRYCCAENGWMLNVKFTAQLVASGPLTPDVPHNALSDAVALSKWHLTQ